MTHEAFFRDGKVVIFALEGILRNALPFCNRIDVERIFSRFLGIAKEEDVVVVALDGQGKPTHIDGLLDVLDAFFVI